MHLLGAILLQAFTITVSSKFLMLALNSQKEDVTDVFKELCNEPLSVTENQLDILEKFILFVYYPKQSKTECINIERMNAFNANPNSNLRLIPFSRNGLREHTKRACLQSGWL